LRNYITTFRVDDSYSSLYAAHEDVFISIGKGEGNGKLKETIYKMDKVEDNLLKNFMYVKNQGLLFNKTNIDVNGKPTIQDPDTNRPIYIGDGIIPQIERFASKYGYNKLTVQVMQTAINMMCQKAENPTGNKFIFVVNEALWNQIQLALSEWLARFNTCGTYLWSKEANGYVKVGATFSTYEIGGKHFIAA